jgi:hypothetical protein
LDELVQTKVTLGTNIQVTILGKGSINILTRKGEKKIRPDVYYVYGLNHNMISIGKLLQKGYIIHMEDNHCVIMDKFPSNILIAKIQMTSSRMFPLALKPTKKKNTTQTVYKGKSAQSNTAFTT